MDISRLRRNLAKWKSGSYLPSLILINLLVLSLAARLIDRDDQGKWVVFTSAFQPDGFNYLIRALEMGDIADPDKINSILSSLYPSSYSQFSTLTTAVSNTLDARPVYPFITSLFLQMNYQIAPLIGPVFAWILLIIIIFILSRRRIGIISTLALVTLFSSSFYMRFNFIATTTDAISGLLFLLFILFLLKRNKTITQYLIFNVIVILCILTRPVDPIILSVLVFYILSNLREFKITLLSPLLIVLGHMYYLETSLHQFDVGSVNTGGQASESSVSYIINAFIGIPKMVITELAFISTNDIILLILLIISAALVLKVGLKEDRWVYFATISSTFFLASLNGTIGSGFRYEIPIVMTSIVIWMKYGTVRNILRAFGY